jgi:hypothetical protein
MLPMQVNPVAQSAVVVQLVRQAVVPQMYGLQFCSVGMPQVPAAVHRAATIAVPFMQLSEPHTVFAGYRRQAPMPSHMPSRPHVMAVWSSH